MRLFVKIPHFYDKTKLTGKIVLDVKKAIISVKKNTQRIKNLTTCIILQKA